MKVGLFIGTRPEIYIHATIIENLPKKIFNILFFDVLEESGWFEKGVQYLTLNYPRPKETIKWMSLKSLEDKVIELIEKYELESIIVGGYSRTVYAVLYASREKKVPVIHIGSGVRTYVKNYDEILRQVIDRWSSIHIVNMDVNRGNLVSEGFDGKFIKVSGFTSVDAVLRNLSEAIKKSSILDELSIDENEYIAVYLNMLNPMEVISDLIKLGENFRMPIIISLPKNLKKILMEGGRYYKIMEDYDILFIEVLDYLDYLALSYYSRMIVTDSYWIIPDLSIMKKPIAYYSRYPDPYNLMKYGVTDSIEPGAEDSFDKLVKLFNRKIKINLLPYLGNGEATERVIDFIKDYLYGGYPYRCMESNLVFKEDSTLSSLSIDEAVKMLQSTFK